MSRLLANSRRPSGEGLHDLRVALRRMAAVTRLTRGLPPGSGARAVAGTARALRRSLSDQRTSEVSADILRRTFARGPNRTAALAAARRILETPSSRGAGTEARTASRLYALRRAVDRRISALEAAAAAPVSPPAQAACAVRFFARLAVRLARLRQAGPPPPEKLHLFRVTARDLRYGFELLDGFWPPADEAVRALRQIQDAAGVAHDLLELTATLRRAAAPGPCRPAEARLFSAVEAASRRRLLVARRVASGALGRLAGIRMPARARPPVS